MACDMAASSSFREKSLYNNCALLFGRKILRWAMSSPLSESSGWPASNRLKPVAGVIVHRLFPALNITDDQIPLILLC